MAFSLDRAGFCLALLFYCVIGAIFLWDLIAIYQGGNYHTVTWWIRYTAREYPLLAYLTWFTLGHCFWPGE